ncbi:hypothetical protein ACN28S_18440 [Cystobacter fuscus]
MVLAEDGTLRAGRFEVGPFYAIEGERLFPVNQQLEVSKGRDRRACMSPTTTLR